MFFDPKVPDEVKKRLAEELTIDQMIAYEDDPDNIPPGAVKIVKDFQATIEREKVELQVEFDKAMEKCRKCGVKRVCPLITLKIMAAKSKGLKIPTEAEYEEFMEAPVDGGEGCSDDHDDPIGDRSDIWFGDGKEQ